MCKNFFSKYLIIRTTTYFYYVWKIVVIILSFISCFYYSLFVSSFNRVKKDKDKLRDLESVNLAFQAFFFIDMIMQFFVEIPA